MVDVVKEIKVFAKLSELLLSIFTDPKINLLEQLVKLAQLGFMLLIIYRRNGSAAMTNDLYLDIQSTIQDAYIAASYFKKESPASDLLLYQLGTDQLENKFCIVRTLTHSAN